ncbi:CoA transferase [Luteimonas aestuarii]|uniref:CoA transferase n=1 Tax=Luteimonas aestuarii TaxID=453837 RepID=A0A4R5TYN6_9GAMM|nr:CaiB/BaiF CoA-transferase family protein [Luteimonas aestuarii]TDK26320.1 CoA transferase [Luteimonas aestuarii]
MTDPHSTTRGPLAGYRVLELCSTIAGPACTRLFADFGAEVIKVEPPQGDPARALGFRDGDVSLTGVALMRNKRSTIIDIKTPEGAKLVRELAATCDIVVENFRPGTLERLGLGYEDLSRDNPGLVMVRISGYGQTGPYRHKGGYGAICEAFGGIRHLIGDPDRPPARVAVPVTDYVTAVYAAFGAMMALLERERSGRGQVVDAALYEAAFSMMDSAVPTYDKLKLVPSRLGTRLPAMAPNNLYPASDGTYVLIAANSQAVYERLACAIERTDIIQDPRFATIRARWDNVDALDAIIGDWVGAQDAKDVESALEAAGVPVSRVYTLPDIFEDAHYRERDMLLDVPHPVLGDVVLPGIVPKLSATPGEVRWAGTEAGSDTRAVLAELLALDEGALDALERSGVIATAIADGRPSDGPTPTPTEEDPRR